MILIFLNTHTNIHTHNSQAFGNWEKNIAKVLGQLPSHGTQASHMSLFVQGRGPELVNIKLVLAQACFHFTSEFLVAGISVVYTLGRSQIDLPLRLKHMLLSI